MMHATKMKFGWLLAAALFVPMAAAQDDASDNGNGDMAGQTPEVRVSEHDEFGPILTDAEGNPLYLFVNEDADPGEERVTEGVRGNVAPCADGCLENWPALEGDDVVAGEGVDDERLYVADVDGRNQVVYNGWPLYYFARDEGPGDVQGQGLGQAPNFWYVVNAEGQPVRADGGMGMDGGDDGAGDDGMGDDNGGDGN